MRWHKIEPIAWFVDIEHSLLIIGAGETYLVKVDTLTLERTGRCDLKAIQLRKIHVYSIITNTLFVLVRTCSFLFVLVRTCSFLFVLVPTCSYYVLLILNSFNTYGY